MYGLAELPLSFDWPTGQMLLHLNLQVRAANVSVS